LAKGIRVNQLAKELDVESKAILAKLRDEGLAEKAPNHMSVLPLGLAESVREWFRTGQLGSGGGTAVETAPPVEAKTKTARAKKKPVAKTEHGAEDHPRLDQATDGQSLAVEEAPAPLAEAPASADTVAPTEEPPAAPGGTETAPPVARDNKGQSKPVAPVPFTPKPAVGVGPKVIAHAQPSRPARFGQKVSMPQGPGKAAASTPTAPPAPVTPPPPQMPIAPVATSPVAPPPTSAAPAAPTMPGRPAPTAGGPGERPPLRATVTLASKAAAERKPVQVAPQLLVKKKAEIKGPVLIREEKPEPVAPPRPRRPMGPGPDQTGPTYTTARPTTGRCVKVTVDNEEEEKKKAAAKGKSLSSRRRGVDGRRGEAMEKLKEFTDADLIERRDRLNAAASYRTGFDSHLKKSESRGTHVQAKTAVEKGGVIEVEEPINVKSLSAALGVKGNEIQSRLMRKGILVTPNQTLDAETAALVALEFGLEIRVAQRATLEEQLLGEFQQREAKAEDIKARPPVVTILGHVDHGKTSLLDKIRHANVAAGEAGGITQHTAAWTVEVNGKRVTFIDTPGHQAFTSMRARGANMTDIVVLVVAAVEGVMPQTIESINHARAAGVPIVVAMNKIDRPDAQPDMVLGQLAKEGLNPVEWGGDVEVVRTSALTGQGIEELIETLDYQAELLELKADPTAPARGTVIESRMEEGLGSIATVLIQDGTLRLGDIGLSGAGFGRVRMMQDDRGNQIKEAGPSTPVLVSGLSELPAAGDPFFAVDDMDRARAIAEDRAVRSRQTQLGAMSKVTADNLIATMQAGDVQTINLIIKADTQGSIETLVKTVGDQNTNEVKVRVVHSGVGPISESDVQLAMATKTKATDNRVAIIGFHVVPEEEARVLAEHNHIDVKLYRVIYEIFDDLKKALSGMLTPEEREKLHGHAEVRQVFKVSRMGNIAGCMVTDGHIQRGSKIRLIRNGTVVTEGISIDSLKRVKDDVKEVKTGFECGIKLVGYDDLKVGDVLEAYVKETFERTL
jgi:translation initiation factor IF-2